VMPLSVQIERRVVMVFRGLSGLVGGHPAFRGSGLSLAGRRVLREAEPWDTKDVRRQRADTMSPIY
jgi:hypothetical protein